MKTMKYIVPLLLFSLSLHGETLIINDIQSSNYIYSCIIKHILKKENDKKVSIVIEKGIAYISYANKNNIPFYPSPGIPNVFTKKRGKYIATLFIRKDKLNTIHEANFIITKDNKKKISISLSESITL